MKMLEIRNLTVKFGSREILKDFSYTFPENDIYCITGASGCGKTTLLRTIGGLIKPTGGQVIINGKKVIKPNRDAAIVFQRYDNFPWLNTIDNALFAIKMQRKVKQEDRHIAKLTLERFGLGDALNKYPRELSGGMNQRLAMAAVIMQNPPVLLMDEPLSALDPENRANLQDFLLELNDGTRLIIIVTHSDEEAEKLSKGKILKLEPV